MDFVEIKNSFFTAMLDHTTDAGLLFWPDPDSDVIVGFDSLHCSALQEILGHLREAGFTVKVHDDDNIDPVVYGVLPHGGEVWCLTRLPERAAA